MEKDIFGDDPKFGDNKEKPDTSFGEGVGDIIKGFTHLFKGIAQIFLKKFNLNLLVLLILLLAVFFGALYFLKKEITEPALSNIKCPEALLFSSGGKVDVKEISSQCKINQEEAEKALTESKKRYEEDNSNLKIVNEENLWEITCPTPEPCPELNCSSCPVKTETQNIIYYKCKDGRLVTDEESCKPKYPEITSSDVATSAAGDVTFSIDRLDYSSESNNSARLLKINYTIINKRETKIMPRIAVKTYEEWTPEVAAEEPHFTISHGDILNGEEWIQVSKGISIFITNKKHKISFQLQNTLPDPDENIAGARIVKILEYN